MQGRDVQAQNLIKNPGFENLNGVVDARGLLDLRVVDWNQSCNSTSSPSIYEPGAVKIESFGNGVSINTIGIPDNVTSCNTYTRDHSDPADPFYNLSNEHYTHIEANAEYSSTEDFGIRGTLSSQLNSGVYRVSFWYSDFEDRRATNDNHRCTEIGPDNPVNRVPIAVDVRLIRNSDCDEAVQVVRIPITETYPTSHPSIRPWYHAEGFFCLSDEDNPADFDRIEFEGYLHQNHRLAHKAMGIHIDDVSLEAYAPRIEVVDHHRCGTEAIAEETWEEIINDAGFELSDLENSYLDNGDGVFDPNSDVLIGLGSFDDFISWWEAENYDELVDPKIFMYTETDGLSKCIYKMLTINVINDPVPQTFPAAYQLCPSDLPFILNGENYANPDLGQTFNWTNGNSPNDPILQLDQLAEGQHSFELIVTNFYGCSASTEIIIDMLPDPDPILLNVTGGGCDELVTIQVLNNLNATFTIDWDLSDAIAATPISGQAFSNSYPPGTYQYEVTATTSCGTVSIIGFITIYPKPVITAFSQTFCKGDVPNIVLDGASFSSGTGYQYSWNHIPSTNPLNASLFAPGSYAKDLTVTNQYGCSSTATIFFNIKDVPQIPTIDENFDPCTGEFCFTVTNNPNVPVYFDGNNDGIGDLGLLPNTEHCQTYPPGDHTFRLIAENAGQECGTAELVKSFTVHEPPTISLFPMGDCPEVTIGTNITTGTGVGIDEITWAIGSKVVTTYTAPITSTSFTTFTTGDVTYTVTVVDENGCSASADIDIECCDEFENPELICEGGTLYLILAQNINPFAYNGLGGFKIERYSRHDANGGIIEAGDINYEQWALPPEYYTGDARINLSALGVTFDCDDHRIDIFFEYEACIDGEMRLLKGSVSVTKQFHNNAWTKKRKHSINLDVFNEETEQWEPGVQAEPIIDFSDCCEDEPLLPAPPMRTGESSFSALEVDLTPNPVVDVLKVTSSMPMTQLRVVAVDGRGVQKNVFTKYNVEYIDLSELSSGVYILEVTTELGIEFLRVLKN